MALAEFTCTSSVNKLGDNNVAGEVLKDMRFPSASGKKRKELLKMWMRVDEPGEGYGERRLFGYGSQIGCFQVDPKATARSIRGGKDLAAYARFVVKMQEKRVRDWFREFSVMAEEVCVDV